MKIKTQQRQERGFTLLELLMVVIIVGILASLALPGYIRATEQARASEAVTALGQLKGAMQRYCLQRNGTPPTAYADLDIEDPHSNPQFLSRWGNGAGAALPFPVVTCPTAAAPLTVTIAFGRQAGPCVGSTVTLTTPVAPPAQEITYTWLGSCV